MAKANNNILMLLNFPHTYLKWTELGVLLSGKQWINKKKQDWWYDELGGDVWIWITSYILKIEVRVGKPKYRRKNVEK